MNPKKITINFFAHKIKRIEPNRAGDRLLYIQMQVDPIEILTAIDNEGGINEETLGQIVGQARLTSILNKIKEKESNDSKSKKSS